jgi:hypothetical protein
MGKHRRIPGIFPHLVNEAAFVDKLVMGVWGVRRAEILDYIAKEKSRAIGGHGRAYARCIPGRNTATGNPLQFKYGVMLPYKGVSPYVVQLLADRQPVTCADAILAMDGFMRLGCRAKVSQLELTFDTEGIPLELFTWELCTTARTFREMESDYGATLYAGGVNSSWQLKIYQKTDAIVRVEFTIRNMFLRKVGIVRAPEAYLLRRAHLWDHASFREVDQSEGDALPPRIRKHWTKLGHGLPPDDMPACIVIDLLREARIDPARWVVRSQREDLLRKMQHNMIW